MKPLFVLQLKNLRDNLVKYVSKSVTEHFKYSQAQKEDSGCWAKLPKASDQKKIMLGTWEAPQIEDKWQKRKGEAQMEWKGRD